MSERFGPAAGLRPGFSEELLIRLARNDAARGARRMVRRVAAAAAVTTTIAVLRAARGKTR